MNIKEKLTACEADNARLQQMALEFSAFMNYVIEVHGVRGSYTVDKDKFKSLPLCPIKTEIVNSPVSGRAVEMKFTRIMPGDSADSPSLIIAP